MSTKFLSPGWRMPRNANQSKSSNYSLIFDPANAEHINLGTISEINGLTNFSFSLWMKPKFGSPRSDKLVFGNRDSNNSYRGVALLIGDSVLKRSTFFIVSATGTIYLALGTNIWTENAWNHFAVTYDGSQIKAYINNGSPITGSVSGATLESTSSFYVGKDWNTTQYFRGQLGEFAIFNYALSESQVTTLYGTESAIGNPMALPSSPIAYYPLGGSAGAFRTPVNVNDQWLTENNAIGDYVFDFASSTISIGNLSSVEGSDFTISLWLNKDSAHSSVIYNSGSAYPNGLIFQSNQNGSFFISVGGGDGTTSTMTISDGVWYNAILTVSGTTAKVYVNGSQLGSDLTVGSARTGIGSGTVIGEYNHSSGFDFNGKLSNVQVFNTALSGPEVETLYNYGSPIQTLANIPQNSNLKAWYKLDATEIYNSSITDWEVNNALSPWTSSLNFNRARSASISLGSSSSIRPTGDYTISIWYNLNSTVNAGVWCAGSNINNSGLTLFSSAQYAGGLALYHKGGSGTSAQVNLGSGSIVLNNWHNAIFTYDDTSRVIKGYLNGDLIDTVNVAGTGSVSWSNSFYLGRLIQNGSYYLDGRLSNFQIFNTKLEETGSNSVETLYNSGNPLTDMSSFSSLVSWWKLNNTTTGIEDSKGSNNGTNNKATEALGSVSTLNGLSSGMSQSNLIQSDLQTVAPYSKYAMSFDGVSERMAFNSSPIDLGLSSTETWWIKYSNTSSIPASIASAPVFAGFHILYEKTTNKVYYRIDTTNLYYEWVIPSTYFSDNLWHHYVIVRDDSLPFSSYIKLYIDGNLFGNPTAVNATSKSTTNTKISDWGGASAYPGIIASFSNIAFWDTALTANEAKEIYNEGLPSNLHNFSGTAPVVWWQMGSNSSYVNGWTCADEIGANNGTTSNIGEESLVNGVGTTANGVSSGMSEGSLIGDAPYSTANAISSGMPVTARGTDVPS